MTFEDRPEWRLLVALGVGLVLGLERERARGAERPRRAVTKVVLAAISGPRVYLVRVVAGQLSVLGATWAGWLPGRG